MLTQETQPLVVTRVLKAPIEKVFKAWTDPALMAKWFKPNERWIKSEPEVELVVGGPYVITMTHQDGDQFKLGGQVLEVVPNEKLSFSWLEVGGENAGRESVVTVTLKPVAEGTELTLLHSKLASSEMKTSVNEGWTGCLDMLAAFVQ